jgi:hypothetical protein
LARRKKWLALNPKAERKSSSALGQSRTDKPFVTLHLIEESEIQGNIYQHIELFKPN